MGASIDKDTHAKSRMAESPNMLGKKGGGVDRRVSSFATG